MNRRDIMESDDDREFLLIRETYLIDIVKPLTNLTPDWIDSLKNGSLKLQFAVQIGSVLTLEQQQRFMEFVTDVHVPDKDMGKVLHAFALNMPEWSIHSILRIYKLAEKTKSVIIMYNDLMDEYELLFQQFEYEFLDGKLPGEHEQLERALYDTENGFQTLYSQAPVREKSNFNRFYGDSSSSCKDYQPRQADISFPTIIGVVEDASTDEIRRQSRRLLKKLHPDRGGSAYLFDWVKKAYDAHISITQ